MFKSELVYRRLQTWKQLYIRFCYLYSELSVLENLELLDLSFNELYSPLKYHGMWFCFENISYWCQLFFLLSKNIYLLLSLICVEQSINSWLLRQASKLSDNNTWSSLKKLWTLNLANNCFGMEILRPLAGLPTLRSFFLNDNNVKIVASEDTRLEGLDDKGICSCLKLLF